MSRLSAEEVAEIKKVLEDLHVNKQLSLLEISKQLNRSFTFVWLLCRKLGIEIRPLGQANKVSAGKRSRRAKSPFDGTEEDRAYMQGFAEGDLDVRRASSLAIMVSSTTTHPAFAELFASLFSIYGPIYEYPIFEEKRGYRWKVAARLDNSFSFLVPNERKCYPSFSEGKSRFLAWFAGILDSDGNINTVKARQYVRTLVEVYNEDLNLLNHIKTQFALAGFNWVGPYLLSREGKVTPSWNIVYRKDMLSIMLERRAEVLALLKILPLRHREKRERSDLVISLADSKWEESGERVLAMRNRIKDEVLVFQREAEEFHNRPGAPGSTPQLLPIGRRRQTN